MCAVIGVLAHDRVSQMLYDALTIVQHRGQDAAGIMTSDQRRIYLRKSTGLVRDAIREKHVHGLLGNIGIGHVRYPTAGTDSAAEAQPFYVNSPYGIGIVHNGNLTNAAELTQVLADTDHRHLNTNSDSEVILNVFADELQRVAGDAFDSGQLFTAMRGLYTRLQGAYAAVAMINGHGLVAFRDPHGIRPLVFGQRESAQGKEYMVASESIALSVLGFDYVDDVQPGEAILFGVDGQIQRQVCARQTADHPCLFEYIYLARPDSVMHGISVYRARQNMGAALGRKIADLGLCEQIDCVIPVPDTSRTAALALAQQTGLEYSEGFVKNRYIGRTFIMPEQTTRRHSVRLKLHAMREEFLDRCVLLVDDSIVRGTTSQEIIQMARDAGAKRVFFASAAPPIRFPNIYGIDMPSSDELIAHDQSIASVAKSIGADRLIYQDLDAVVSAVNAAATVSQGSIKRFEDSVFSGHYVAGRIQAGGQSHAAAQRTQKKRLQAELDRCVVYSGDDDILVRD